MKKESGRRTFILKSIGLLVLIIYTGVLFRYNFIRIFDNVLSGDEAYSASLIGMSLIDMFLETAADVHPPLYYLFLRFLSLFGNSGTIYHLSALIPYALIMVFAVVVIRKEFGYVPALILVTMSSMGQSAVKYNVEIRMYSLACMFTLFAFYEVYRILRRNQWKDWMFFAIFSLGAAYSHYYALLSVAFFYALFLLLTVRKREYMKKWAVTSLLTIIGYLPWLYFFLSTFLRVTDSWWVEQYFSAEDCLLFLLDYIWVAIVFAAVFVAYMAYGKGLIKITKTVGKKEHTEDIHVELGGKITQLTSEGVWIIWGLVSVIGTAAVGMAVSKLANPVFIPRYLFPVSASLYLIFGVCFSKLQMRWVWSICFMAAFLHMEFSVYEPTAYFEEVLSIEADAFCRDVQLEDDDIFLTNSSHHAWTILGYYYENYTGKYITELSEAQDVITGKAWLLWLGELQEEDYVYLKELGWNCEYVRAGYLGEEEVLYIYRLEKTDIY
ncbi:MAG: glycosyltransferase family 39 protein [Lachnospiraceae bacterium]|nr:glycosyltransferase family 39 protein [Lachnospiraceae bacterium]